MKENYFLAVCKDRPNDPERFYYTVYFVNNSSEEIKELSYETGGFATFDDELVQTSTHRQVLGALPAFSAMEVETDDEGAFDFDLNFNFKLEFLNGKCESCSFSIGKYLRGGEEPFEPLPVLGQMGHRYKSR
ncbi:hypothetical protein [Rossellomorea vietnamensis]|uniref:hypothetical protein n=1 Tax=Rossellomorea vietnamensis TaxID=218284 RepID=UPI00077CB125|nr:hypothetical protein [Rossellomorea vietnamensis]